MEYQHILVQAQPPVGRITLNRPAQRNALSLELMNEVIEGLSELAGLSEVQAIVIEGAGPAFSAGHDMGEMLDRPREFYDELFDRCTAMMQTVHGVPQPVIAKVAGIATAAGCQLVASCDLVVASEDAKFATPGVKIGLFCTTPMVPVTRAVGQKRAMEMLLTGESISARTAREWGLVNRVVPAEQLEDAVMDLVATITQYSPDTIGVGKGAFYRQVGTHEDEAYEITKPIMAGAATTADAQEGFSAFLEKRPASWSHRGGGE